MTPDPAPYGADLPRPPVRNGVCMACGSAVLNGEHLQDNYSPCQALAALDAANAEVLALRAERDALREVVEAVRSWWERTRDENDAPLNCSDDAMLARLDCAAEVLALLPAPTEGDG